MFEEDCTGGMECPTSSSSGISSNGSQKTNTTTMTTSTAATTQTTEDSLSLSSLQLIDQLPEEISKGAAKSLDEKCLHSASSSKDVRVRKLRSFSDWENRLLMLSTEGAGGDSAAARIHLQLSVLFKNRLRDIEQNAPHDLEARLEIYEEWATLLVRFNRSVFNELEELDELMIETRSAMEALSSLSRSRRDLTSLIEVIAAALNQGKFDFTGVQFETLSIDEILGMENILVPDSETHHETVEKPVAEEN